MDENRIQFYENELRDLDKQAKEAFKLFTKVSQDADKLRNEIEDYRFELKFKDGITPEKFLSITNWNSLKGERLNSLKVWITSNYFDKGVYTSGYYPETGQPALKIKLDQNRPLEFQKGILDFIPYIKPLPSGAFRDYKVIGIFEDSLSEHGTWNLIYSNKEILLTINRREQSSFKSMDEALNYIYNRLPYKRLGDPE